MRQLLLDVLRWWVTEYQVDGFCFVNAENLTQVCGFVWVKLRVHTCTYVRGWVFEMPRALHCVTQVCR